MPWLTFMCLKWDAHTPYKPLHMHKNKSCLAISHITLYKCLDQAQGLYTSTPGIALYIPSVLHVQYKCMIFIYLVSTMAGA